MYTVDALVGSGNLPMTVAGDSGDDQVDGFPVLRRGESVTLRGYTVAVIGDNDDTHTVTITKDSRRNSVCSRLHEQSARTQIGSRRSLGRQK